MECGLAEEYHRRVGQPTVLAEQETIEDVWDGAARVLRQAPGFDAQAHGAQDLLVVEVVQGALGGEHFLPGGHSLAAIQEMTHVLRLRHGRVGRPNALVGPPTVGPWTEARCRLRVQHQNLATAFDGDTVHTDGRLGLEVPEHGRHPS